MKKIEKVLPYLLLVSFVILTHFKQAEIADGIILIALCGLSAYRMYLNNKEVPDIRKEVNHDLAVLYDKIKVIESQVGQINVSNNQKALSERFNHRF
jgi:hypothetical protein